MFGVRNGMRTYSVCKGTLFSRYMQIIPKTFTLFLKINPPLQPPYPPQYLLTSSSTPSSVPTLPPPHPFLCTLLRTHLTTFSPLLLHPPPYPPYHLLTPSSTPSSIPTLPPPHLFLYPLLTSCLAPKTLSRQELMIS